MWPIPISWKQPHSIHHCLHSLWKKHFKIKISRLAHRSWSGEYQWSMSSFKILRPELPSAPIARPVKKLQCHLCKILQIHWKDESQCPLSGPHPWPWSPGCTQIVMLGKPCHSHARHHAPETDIIFRALSWEEIARQTNGENQRCAQSFVEEMQNVHTDSVIPWPLAAQSGEGALILLYPNRTLALL